MIDVYNGCPNCSLRAKCGPLSSHYWPAYNSVSYMSVYIVNFSHLLKKCLIMISPEDSISATIEGNDFDIIYVGELELRTELTVLIIVCGPTRCLLVCIWPLLQ